MADVKRAWMNRATKSSRGSGSYGKFADGVNYIRIFAFNHTVTPGDFDLQRYSQGDFKSGDVVEEWYISTRKHFGGHGQKGPKTCGRIATLSGDLLGTCQSCEQADACYRTGKEEDKAIGRRLSATKRFAVNAVQIIDGKPGTLSLFELPPSVFEPINDAVRDLLQKGRTVFGTNGRTFCIRKVPGSGNDMTKYSASTCDSLDSPALTTYPGWSEPKVPDLFNSRSFLPDAFWKFLPSSSAGTEEAGDVSDDAMRPGDNVRVKDGDGTVVMKYGGLDEKTGKHIVLNAEGKKFSCDEADLVGKA